MANQGAYLTGKGVVPFEIRDGEIYKPESDEVIIKNSSIAFNPVDWKIQYGGYFMEDADCPTILGYDIAGIVEATGSDVKNVKKGDRVLSFTPQLLTKKTRHGGFQAYSASYGLATTRLPDSLSFDSASTIPLAASTAVHGLFHKDFFNLARPSGSPDLPKSTGVEVLIWGGATSVGQYAIQLASQGGNTVYATASAKHHDALIALGAAKVFDYNSSTVIEDIKKAAPKLAYVFDTVSEGKTPQQSFAVLQNGGKVCATLPYPEDVPSGVQVHQVFAAVIMASDKDLGEWFFGKYLPAALESGRFVPNKVEKRPGGIKGVQDVLAEYQSKGISGAKFVINP